MTDADWRRLQRTWEVDPGDQTALAALLAARRRAGVAVTRELLDARRFPPRSFRCVLPYFATVSTRPGAQVNRLPVDGRIELPEHTSWTLVFPGPLPHEGALGALLFELEGERLLGLQLKGPGLSDEGLATLAATALPGLESLRLQQGQLGAAGVAALAGLPDLIELELVACGHVDDAALAALAGLPGLLRLELGQLAVDGSGLAALGRGFSPVSELAVWGCELSPQGLEAIAGLEGLRDLQLRGTLIDDRALETLSGLTGLERLHLGETPALTDRGLAACARLTRLRHLWLGQTPQVTDAGVEALTELPLRRLTLTAPRLGDAGFGAIARVGSLEELSLWGQGVTDEGLTAVAGLAGLRELSLAFLPEQTTDAGFATLSGLRQLVELDLFACAGLTTAGLGFARELPALRSVSLSHCDSLHDGGPEALAGLPLTRLTLSAIEGLHDEALRAVATLTALEVLRVVACSTVSGSWLETLAALPNLVDLDLSFCVHVEPDALKHLALAPRLRALDLTGLEGLTNASLGALEALPELEDLNLDGCLNLSDGALAHLGRCRRLRILSLDGCPGLSDEGLRHLRGLPNLHLLYLGGGGITRAGVEVLRRALPNCDVVNTTAP